MNLAEMLEKLRKEALADPGLRERLLDTRKEKAPLSAFCSLCRELGYPIYEMDLSPGRGGILCLHAPEH